jgi:uncharacterized protein (TIGR01568 family)
MYKTVNSVYQLDYLSADGSCFGDEEEEDQGLLLELEVDDDGGFSTTTASEEWSEAVIRSLGRTSTDRFFVDPGPASNSIMALSPGKSAAATTSEEESAPSEPSSLVEESVAVAVDSEDPYGDFRASMEEMVAAHGLRGWEALEELLVWYLRINGKHNHALIVGAFVDLLVGLAGPPPPSSSSAAPTATTTATTMTTATTSRSGGSTTSTSTSSSTCGCGGDAALTAATAEEQCSGRNDEEASRSPASSDNGLHGCKEKQDLLIGDKAGDDRSISGTH